MTTAGENPGKEKRTAGKVTARALYGLAGIAGILAGLALTWPSLTVAAGAALACGRIAQWFDAEA